MLTARLYIIGAQLNGTNELNQVSTGAIIIEDDLTLPQGLVSAELVWGDGSANYAITPIASPYHAAAQALITRQGSVLSLTLDPPPYVGSFSLYYGLELLTALAYNISTANLQSILQSALSAGESVQITGSSPSWTLVFDSEATAVKISAGANPSLFAPVMLPLHYYPTGNFSLELIARNYRSPNYGIATSTQQLTLQSDSVTQKPPIIIGPVLASDVGFPNTSQWNFNTSTDVQVLASNIKMILLTELGERYNLPNYGCSLRKYIFDPIGSTTSQDINSEISRAIDTWEPRAKIELIDSTIDRPNRAINVELTLVSQLNRERFQLNIELER